MTNRREQEHDWTPQGPPKIRKNEKPSRWSKKEHAKFLAGLEKFGLQDKLGPGGADLMAAYMGDRSALQIKSHMQQYRTDSLGKSENDSSKVKRNKKSCAACRRAKYKCDGFGGCCTRCKQKGIPCVADSGNRAEGPVVAAEGKRQEEPSASGQRSGETAVAASARASPDGSFGRL
eukprot:2633019-Rhodomonas_salina.2